MKLVNAMPLKRAKPDVRETKTGMLKVDAIRARSRNRMPVKSRLAKEIISEVRGSVCRFAKDRARPELSYLSHAQRQKQAPSDKHGERCPTDPWASL